MTDILSSFDGVWVADDRPLTPDGCAIGPDGWRIVVEAFYIPDDVRRFGLGTFGSENFGDYPDSPGGVEAWVDWSSFVSALEVHRGVRTPNVRSQTDELSFALYDPKGTIMRWLGDRSLSSPNIGTPIRVSLVTPEGVVEPIVTARINRVTERHGATAREIEFYCLGTKSELRTDLLPELFVQETAAERIDYVRAAIQLPDPFEPYPANFATTILGRDPEIRGAVKTEAYWIISECAFSCGYMVFTTRTGSVGWLFIGDGEPTPTSALISDCSGRGEDAVSTSQFWSATDDAILNVVQVWASDLQFSAEAIDATSVARFGRRSRGFGFPINVANKDRDDAQDIADSILARTKLRVNRVSQLEFHTLTDPRWFPLLEALDIGTSWNVERTQPFEGESIVASVIGYDLNIVRSHIEGVIYTSTPHETV